MKSWNRMGGKYWQVSAMCLRAQQVKQPGSWQADKLSKSKSVVSDNNELRFNILTRKREISLIDNQSLLYASNIDT